MTTNSTWRRSCILGAILQTPVALLENAPAGLLGFDEADAGTSEARLGDGHDMTVPETVHAGVCRAWSECHVER